MPPPRTDLAPPKDDPFTLEQLKQFDGSQSDSPIYIAVKGAVLLVVSCMDAFVLMLTAFDGATNRHRF